VPAAPRPTATPTSTPPAADPDPAHPRDPATTTDPTLAAEQAHLAAARAHLERMRARTLSLRAHSGDAVSEAYLAAVLERRANSLIDDATTSLFFGRTDHDDGDRWYIGRRHVADEHGDPVVVDWRADVSRPFYRAGRSDPLGVLRRRRFGVERGRITAYEDEDLAGGTAAAQGGTAQGTTGPGGILAREIERPRVGPMRDIVATIQPEQDEIVRAGPEVSICVQGAPGTGKTAVGLHRAAWLLYAHRDRLSRSGVLVVGPNRSFLEHVGAVLPSLGEVQVAHTTVQDMVVPAGTRVAGQDATPVATLKGDERMAAVLQRAVWSHVREPVEALVLPRGSRRWRIPGYEAAAVVAELSARGVRYSAARDMLAHRLAHALLVLMEEAGDSPDDRVQDAVARSREVRRYVDDAWPALEPRRVLWRLLTDQDFLADCTAGILEPDERDLLSWPRAPRSPGAARWSVHDAVLMDEVADLLSRTPSLGHVVLDEAQDLSPMQLRAVGRRCSTGATTVLGDIAQGTTAWATASWQQSLRHLGHPEAVVEVLDRGFRVPHAVITYAARLLPLIAPGMGSPTSVRDDPGSLEVVRAAGTAALWAAVLAAVRSALAREGSVAVIVPDGWVERASRTLTAAQARHEVLGEAHDVEEAGPARLVVVPATTAKGLEYDRVVVVEPAAIAQDEPTERTGLRRLYVVLTRAVSGLTVVHDRPLPEPLAIRG